MTPDLTPLLLRVGEAAVERPASLWMTEKFKPGNLTARDQYALALEATCARLCERLAEAQNVCGECHGRGETSLVIARTPHETCRGCSGTGKASHEVK